jgi:hypothetical protein
MNINLSISPALTIIDKIAVVIFKASAPNVIVDSQEFNPPHSSPRNITFIDVDPGTYIVNTYETTGLPTLGTLRHSFIFDPTFASARIKATDFITIAAPFADTTQYEDTDWKGWTVDTITRNGSRILFEGVDFDFETDIDGDVIGFNLLQIGDILSEGEQFVVTFLPEIVTAEATITTSKFINDTVTITANTTIDETYAGKLTKIQSATSKIVIDLPQLGTIESFLLFPFSSNGGSHVNAVFNTFAGDFIKYLNDDLTQVILGQSEELWLLNTPTEWLVIKGDAGIKNVGQIVDSYDNTDLLNLLFCNGQELNRDVYPRLWNFINQLPGTILVSEATWQDTTGGANNKGKFSTGDGVLTFRLPLLHNAGYLRGVDGSARLAGSYSADSIKDHQHITQSGGVNGLGGAGAFGLSLISYLLGIFSGAGSGRRDLTSVPCDATGALGAAITETKPKDYGIYKLIRI